MGFCGQHFLCVKRSKRLAKKPSSRAENRSARSADFDTKEEGLPDLGFTYVLYGWTGLFPGFSNLARTSHASLSRCQHSLGKPRKKLVGFDSGTLGARPTADVALCTF